jgi:surface protein
MASLPNLSHLRPTAVAAVGAPTSPKRAVSAAPEDVGDPNPDDDDNQFSRLPDAVIEKILNIVDGSGGPESMCVNMALLCATNKGMCPEDFYHHALIALKMPPNGDDAELDVERSWKERFTGVCREDSKLRAADGWMRRGILTASLEWEDREFRLHTAVRRLEDYGPDAYPHLAWLMRARGGKRELARKAVPDELSTRDVSELSAENKYTHSTYGPIAEWDVADVTSMYGLFRGASSFNGDLSKWDVSNVRKMDLMFFGAISFNCDLSKWDVSNVTIMNHMFCYARIFNGDLSKWNVSSVTSMAAMFWGATSFNRDLSAWNVSKVEVMYGMFYAATSFNADLSKWKVSQVTSMANMFSNADSFDVTNNALWYWPERW